MSTGYSGYSDAKTANLGANTSEPEAPKNFILKQTPEIEDGKAVLTFTFTRPSKTVLTLTEAQSDDVFTNTTVGVTNATTHNANVTVINTMTDLTSLLTTGDIIDFASAPSNKYIIKSITSTQITLTYGLAASVSAVTQIQKCTKTAESSTGSRAFRINSQVGNSVNIYHESSNIINKWVVTTTLGNFLDLDKVLATINESVRSYAKTRLYSMDATPVAIKTLTAAAAGQKGVTCTAIVAPLLFAGDYVCFGDEETFYQIDTVGSDTFTLTTNLANEIPINTQIYKKKIYENDNVTPYTFPDYVNTSLLEFSGNETLIDLAGYELYMKTSLQSQGSLGTLIKSFAITDSNLVNYSDGTSDYVFYAPDDTYNGREMYFGLVAYDTEMPTANKSLADINAYLISLSTPVNITSVTLNTETKEATINFGTVTDAGKNPHLLSMMNNNVDTYSVNGGFDIYKGEFVEMDMGKGYYLAVDENNGKIVHPDIISGDFVEVRDVSSRHIWVAQASVNGSVDLNDNVKTYGTASISYKTGHSSINILTKRTTISRSTDSVLPLTSEATPQKQYLTEYSNSFVVTSLTSNKEYLFVMESVDTQITYNKQ